MKAFGHHRFGKLLLWGYGCIVVTFLLTPLVVIVTMSFSSTTLLVFPPVGFSLKWYARAFSVTGLVESFIRSLVLALLCALLSAVFGTMAAIAMANKKFPGKTVITSFFLSPLVFPTIVVGVALLQYFRTIRFDNILLAMLLGHVVVTIPYTIRTVTASLEVFDYTLLDAARVLGADTLRTFSEVMLPVIKPGIFAGGVFSFLVSFDNYTVSMFLTDSKNITLPIRIFNYSQESIDPSVAAVSTIMIFVSIFIFVVGGRLVGVKELAHF